MISKKKTILILGSTGSLGSSIAKKFLNEKNVNKKYEIILTSTNKKKFNKIFNHYSNFDITYFNFNFLKYSETNKFIKFLKKKKIDILINATGSINRSDFTKETLKKWNQILDINLNIPMEIIKIVLKKMIKNKYGKIINFSSQVARNYHPFASPSYEVSKSAIMALNRHLTKKFSKYNINFNTLVPGTISSKMQKTMSKKQVLKIKQNIPQKRLGKPDEIAELVFFLTSDKASYINGASINISGGSIVD